MKWAECGILWNTEPRHHIQPIGQKIWWCKPAEQIGHCMMRYARTDFIVAAEDSEKFYFGPCHILRRHFQDLENSNIFKGIIGFTKVYVVKEHLAVTRIEKDKIWYQQTHETLNLRIVCLSLLVICSGYTLNAQRFIPFTSNFDVELLKIPSEIIISKRLSP